MTPEELAWLRSPEGADAARLAGERLASGVGELRAIEELRRSLPAEQARAAMALAVGRAALASKFRDADELYCDREAAEQASHEVVARYLARRFAGTSRSEPKVADLGCGMGADLLAIAEVAGSVVAVDRDAGRLAMAAANVEVRGLSERVAFVEGELESAALGGSDDLEGCDAVWLDPSRRDSNGRVLAPERWSPPLETALEVARRFGGAGVKLAPGIDRELVPPEGELQFVSLGGQLRAAVLWLGELASEVPRRATVLSEDGEASELAGEADGAVHRVGAVGAYLYDPDASVGRAQLVGRLASEVGAWQVDARVAYLTSDEAIATPFARRFRVLASLPFNERRVVGKLRSLGAGRVEVMGRGSPVDANALEGRINRRLPGGAAGRVVTVALTRVGGELVAIVCEREWG